MKLYRIDQIEHILRSYDPIGLIAVGAPDDEYREEARLIANLNINDPKILAEEIYKIFVHQFDEESAGGRVNYSKIAEEISAMQN